MKQPQFDRIDYALTLALLVLVSLVTPLILVLLPLLQWLGGSDFHWTLTDVGTPSSPTGLSPADDVTLTGGGSVDVHIVQAGATVWLVSLLPALLVSVAVVLVCWQLFRLVLQIERRRPFVDASISALRLIAVTVAVASVGYGLARAFADSVMAARAFTEDVGTSFTLPFIWLLAALLILVVAEAFAQGARLQEDVEGLV